MDCDALRADVPALDDCTYLNTGASGPSPVRVLDAVADGLVDHEVRGHVEGPYEVARERRERAREAVAELLHTAPEHVALTQSTTDGITVAAGCHDWGADDAVVTTALEHSSGTLPWHRLADRDGVDVRTVGHDEGRLRFDELAEAVADASLLCLSHVSWTHGTVLDVARAVDVAHDAGCDVLVDAAQSPGHVPLDALEAWGADFVAATGHKWLLGPWGAGFLWVREPAALDSPRIGYPGLEDHDGEHYEYREGAARLEVAPGSPALQAGLTAAVATLRDVGLDAIRDRIAGLRERLVDGLPSDRLVSPPDAATGLVSFRVDDAAETVARLRDAGVVVRSLPLDGEVVRASLHGFNAPEDVEALLAEVAA